MKIDDSEYGNKGEKLNGEKGNRFLLTRFPFLCKFNLHRFSICNLDPFYKKKKIYKKHSTVKKSTCYEKTLCAGMLKLVVLRAMFQNCG